MKKFASVLLGLACLPGCLAAPLLLDGGDTAPSRDWTPSKTRPEVPTELANRVPAHASDAIQRDTIGNAEYMSSADIERWLADAEFERGTALTRRIADAEASLKSRDATYATFATMDRVYDAITDDAPGPIDTDKIFAEKKAKAEAERRIRIAQLVAERGTRIAQQGAAEIEAKRMAAARVAHELEVERLAVEREIARDTAAGRTNIFAE